MKRYPMSSAQRRLYLQCQLPGGDRAYHLLHLARVRGRFPLSAVETFAARLIERHESARTTFLVESGEFLAQVHEKVPFAFTVVDGKEEDLPAIIEANDQPFDLAVAPLFRVVVLRLSEDEHIFVLNFHHLIFDGNSGAILDWDVFDALAGRELAPVDAGYSDYARWEQRFFESPEYAAQKKYWCEKYQRPPKRLALPLDSTPKATRSFEGDYLIRYVEKAGLKDLSRLRGTTLFTTLLAAFYCTLHKLTGQDEISLGTLFSTRYAGNFQRVTGLFANTLPLTFHVDPSATFAAVVQGVQTLLRESIQRAEYPFEHLVQQLPYREEGARHPLFDVVFNFERVVKKETAELGGLSIEPVDYYAKTSMFDFAIDVVEFPDRVRFRLEYATSIFREETMQGLMDGYCAILQQICRTPDCRVADLALVGHEGRASLLRWNDTAQRINREQTFLDLWRNQLEQHADNPAVRSGARELSYAQVEARANRLANYLVEAGVSPGAVVAVAMDRSPDWVITLLALWKIGAVYLPLSGTHPPKRIAHQLQDSQARLVITQESYRPAFADLARVLTWDGVAASLSSFADHEPSRGVRASEPAYVIYTSGSTGAPKGVLVSHRAVHAHITSLKGTFKLRSDDNVLQYASATFDASLEQILSTLACGACLVLCEAQLQDPRAMLRFLNAEEVSVAEFPPAYLKELVPVLESGSFRTIRKLLSGGDVLTASVAGAIARHLPEGAQLLNVYGPTEATAAATVFTVSGELDRYQSWPSLPIGKPLPNTRIYVLGPSLEILPVGVSGELCIAGDRLADGYLNAEALTREKFVQIKAFGPEERVYRTGDRARWMPDGNLEFLGRMDRQVQLRGYRIELGEIEQALREHPGVREAIVQKSGEDRENLAAFVVPGGAGELQPRALHAWLRERLPEYMVPATITLLESIPRNVDGKVDAHALAVSAERQVSTAREMPLDPLELDLWSLWRRVLKVPGLGRDDVFFQVGGNSLSAIQVMVECKNRYGVDLPLPLMLKAPTISTVADYLRRAARPIAKSGIVSLNAEGTEPPIVLIPGIGGNVLDLYELSRHLDKRHPCVGLQLQWEGEQAEFNRSIEALAGACLKELEATIDPRGCVLLGHSFGGYVAYELARLLQQSGRGPKSLVLLDVAAPRGSLSERKLDLSERDWVHFVTGDLLGNPPTVRPQPTVRPERSDEGAQSKGSLPALYEDALSALKQANRMPRNVSIAQFRQYVSVIAQRAAAFAGYEPLSGIDAEVFLYRASEGGELQGFTREDGHWPELCGGSFTWRRVPGGHFTMAKGAHASELARLIDCEVLRSEARSAP